MSALCHSLNSKTCLNTGNLKVQTFNGVEGDFLPVEEDESEMECLQNTEGVQVPCFGAGDIRANEQIGLVALWSNNTLGNTQRG